MIIGTFKGMTLRDFDYSLSLILHEMDFKNSILSIFFVSE